MKMLKGNPADYATKLVSKSKKIILCTHSTEEPPSKKYIEAYRVRVKKGITMKRIIFGRLDKSMKKICREDKKILGKKYFEFRKSPEGYRRMLIVDGRRAISVINGKVFLFEGKKEVEELLDYFDNVCKGLVL